MRLNRLAQCAGRKASLVTAVDNNSACSLPAPEPKAVPKPKVVPVLVLIIIVIVCAGAVAGRGGVMLLAVIMAVLTVAVEDLARAAAL